VSQAILAHFAMPSPYSSVSLCADSLLMADSVVESTANTGHSIFGLSKIKRKQMINRDELLQLLCKTCPGFRDKNE
jgi:hypothetical protein